MFVKRKAEKKDILIIYNMMRDEDMKKTISDMYKDVVLAVKEKGLPFDISYSVGVIRTDMKSDKNLDDYIREADEVMYEEKSTKKQIANSDLLFCAFFDILYENSWQAFKNMHLLSLTIDLL